MATDKQISFSAPSTSSIIIGLLTICAIIYLLFFNGCGDINKSQGLSANVSDTTRSTAVVDCSSCKSELVAVISEMIDKKLEGFRGSVVNDSTVTSTAETHVKCTRPCCNPQPKPKVIVRKVYIQKPCKSDRRGEVVYSSTTSKKSVTETFDWGDLDAGDDDCQSCKEEAKASDCGGC